MSEVVTHNGANKGDAPQPQSTLGPALGRRRDHPDRDELERGWSPVCTPGGRRVRLGDR